MNRTYFELCGAQELSMPHVALVAIQLMLAVVNQLSEIRLDQLLGDSARLRDILSTGGRSPRPSSWVSVTAIPSLPSTRILGP